ncbi:sulfurtransferase [Sphingobacterium sp. SRCM116780]|uniref:sulfurtransferase n=1 Tax=Sphingobacterium sp. SRCM116780 TaxID=2907623 RepID=UPI001F439F22|nr:sulfurtransferase [Sphingobacterium sp. SRCM116780]UIR56496.1 sulfurtransferase [Sphingobacterium sp. SRCM116780]
MYFPSPLISALELKQELNNPQLIILDCTIDKVGQSLKDSPLTLIPNSLFFDIENRFSDPNSKLPHTLVSEEIFTKEAQALSINQDSILVLYDRWGIYSSPRAWWMFKVMGFNQVYVLNGGLPAWIEHQYAVSEHYASIPINGNFQAHFTYKWYADKDYILERYKNNDTYIFDARSNGRFNGAVAEPRKGLRGGHIPNSHNLPFEVVLNGNYYRTKEELSTIFEASNSSGTEQIFTCGSGITASIIAFSSYLAGHQNIRVYDGSWAEWGQENLILPIVS